MAFICSSSSSPSPTWNNSVFASFHGPDVPKTFLSLQKQLNDNAITILNVQGIERGQEITPALIQAMIRGTRISIVALTKNYASSSRRLDELVEILKCGEDFGQIVIPVFYGVDPSDVSKQTGDFGIAFNETCARKTEEERQRWSQALADVTNLGGYDFRNWDNEAEMIKKIAKVVSDILNATRLKKDFDSMVGLEVLEVGNEPSSSNNQRYRGMVANMSVLMMLASMVADDFSSIRKPYLSRISVVLSIIAVVLSILDLSYIIGPHIAHLRWKWMPMPWFYYPSPNYNLIFGSFTDTAMFYCIVGQLIQSIIICSFMERRQDPPSKVIVCPLFCSMAMVISTLMERPITKSSAEMAILVINVLMEITSAVSDQLSSIRKPHLAKISLMISVSSVFLSILDFSYKIRAHRACFQWKWRPVPWFYYPARNYSRTFGSFTDNALLFCGVGQLIVSTINFSFIERRLDGPIKLSVWPLFFAIGMFFSKFMEKPAIYKEN